MRIASFSTIKQDDHELPIGGDDTCQMIESKCRPLQEEHLGPLGLVTVTQPLKVFFLSPDKSSSQLLPALTFMDSNAKSYQMLKCKPLNNRRWLKKLCINSEPLIVSGVNIEPH